MKHVIALFIVFTLMSTPAAFTWAAAVDEDFGIEGTFLFDHLEPVSPEAVMSMAVNPEDGMTTVGYPDRHIETVLARVTEEGILDANFGDPETPGYAILNDVTRRLGDGNPRQLMITSEGNYLMVSYGPSTLGFIESNGRSGNRYFGGSFWDITKALEHDGTFWLLGKGPDLDRNLRRLPDRVISFQWDGADGPIEELVNNIFTPIHGAVLGLSDAAILSDGSIILSGITITPILGGGTRFATVLAKLGADGTIDRSFGDDGLFFPQEHSEIPFSHLASSERIAIDSQDSISLLLTTQQDHSFVMKVSSDGELIEDFGEQGVAALNQNGYVAKRIVVDSEDGLWIAANLGFRSNSLLLRLTSEGAIAADHGDEAILRFPDRSIGTMEIVADRYLYIAGGIGEHLETVPYLTRMTLEEEEEEPAPPQKCGVNAYSVRDRCIGAGLYFEAVATCYDGLRHRIKFRTKHGKRACRRSRDFIERAQLLCQDHCR
jgi:hypothetical protein